MSQIVEARKLLAELAADLEEDGHVDAVMRIRDEILPLMVRRPAVRRGRAKHPAITAAKRDEIKERLTLYPKAHLDEIARACGVNAGRVSEVQQGDYDDL